MPAAVVLARSVEDVQVLVRVAAEHRVPVVPRGAGSGLAGGANAIDGCVMLSLTRMDRIIEIDAKNLLAVVEPGVITGDLDRAARETGLSYPPDPSSRDMSTIGGNIATNAGGLCCIKYGVTGDFVLGLEVVLADGSIVNVGRRTRKGVAGYDLTKLFVGSEGTLGVVTQATLRLRPAPLPASTLVASFDRLESAGHAISTIVSGIVPSMLELMDRTTIDAVESWKPLGMDPNAEALLIIQSDAPDQGAELDRIETICNEVGASLVVRSSDFAEAELLLSARRFAFPALEMKGATLLDDVAVPPAAIPQLLRTIEEIAVRNGVVVGTFGHAGEGNMHPTIVFDESDPVSLASARRAFEEIVRTALSLGGTITGEHGIGMLKRSYLADEADDQTIALHHIVKQALDPLGILNPGKAI
jgi:glycolate dehydrogenase FAD-linked subunit